MKTRHSSGTLQQLPPFEPVENCESDKVIRQSIITVALNEVLDVCLVSVIKASLHPKQNARNDRKWQDMSALEEADLIDFVFPDMAAHTEIQEYFERSANISAGKTSHNAPHKSVVR